MSFVRVSYFRPIGIDAESNFYNSSGVLP